MTGGIYGGRWGYWCIKGVWRRHEQTDVGGNGGLGRFHLCVGAKPPPTQLPSCFKTSITQPDDASPDPLRSGLLASTATGRGWRRRGATTSAHRLTSVSHPQPAQGACHSHKHTAEKERWSEWRGGVTVNTRAKSPL